MAGAVPGHRVAQELFCTFWPSQKAPPLSGAGLVQLRLRFCQPRPQLVLQADQSVHVDQPPFTGGKGQHQLELATTALGELVGRVSCHPHGEQSAFQA